MPSILSLTLVAIPIGKGPPTKIQFQLIIAYPNNRSEDWQHSVWQCLQFAVEKVPTTIIWFKINYILFMMITEENSNTSIWQCLKFSI